MFTALGVFIIIVAILLTLIVLIQNPKGGMLSSTFGSMGNQILGASRSTDVVEKITWYLAGAIMILSVGSVFLSPETTTKGKNPVSTQKSEIEEALKNSKSTTSLPSATMPSAQPQTAPAQPQATAPSNTGAPAPEVKK